MAAPPLFLIVISDMTVANVDVNKKQICKK